MADYDIYVLEENAVSISGGEQLDGVTQGDGSHLDGVTITLNSGAWMPISITDTGDSDFADNDGNQRLDGPATLNGVTYATNTQVEAEYGIVLSDGVNSWTVVGVNVRNSAPAYGTIEGLAFIGGPGGFPPVGVALTVVSTFEGPTFASGDYATPVCMVSGTLIDTPAGPRPVEELKAGDAVLTRDNGTQAIRWHGTRNAVCKAAFAPVRFDIGAIGNNRALLLSQQHRVLIEGWQAELLFGANEVLVPAVHLVNDHSIRILNEGEVTYHHLLLDCHAVLRTEGAWSESLCPAEEAMKTIPPLARAEIIELFPELAEEQTSAMTHLGYRAINRKEAMLLRNDRSHFEHILSNVNCPLPSNPAYSAP